MFDEMSCLDSGTNAATLRLKSLSPRWMQPCQWHKRSHQERDRMCCAPPYVPQPQQAYMSWASAMRVARGGSEQQRWQLWSEWETTPSQHLLPEKMAT